MEGVFDVVRAFAQHDGVQGLVFGRAVAGELDRLERGADGSVGAVVAVGRHEDGAGSRHGQVLGRGKDLGGRDLLRGRRAGLLLAGSLEAVQVERLVQRRELCLVRAQLLAVRVGELPHGAVETGPTRLSPDARPLQPHRGERTDKTSRQVTATRPRKCTAALPYKSLPVLLLPYKSLLRSRTNHCQQTTHIVRCHWPFLEKSWRRLDRTDNTH